MLPVRTDSLAQHNTALHADQHAGVVSVGGAAGAGRESYGLDGRESVAVGGDGPGELPEPLSPFCGTDTELLLVLAAVAAPATPCYSLQWLVSRSERSGPVRELPLRTLLLPCCRVSPSPSGWRWERVRDFLPIPVSACRLLHPTCGRVVGPTTDRYYNSSCPPLIDHLQFHLPILAGPPAAAGLVVAAGRARSICR